ncbi:MAG: TIGR03087 family PEP-CTERM/XrtA system glycosyltransferase [Gammaproteobacteria bacterium]
MRRLLFLAHRIPFPPNKGDKIRSYNVLRHLAQDFDVRLGAFVDDPDDLAYVDALRETCSEVFAEPLHGRIKRLLSAGGLLTGEPLSVRYFRSRAMRHWVACTLAEFQPAAVFVFSSTMAQYVMPRPCGDPLLICDMVDVDSAKWTQYASEAGPLTRAVFAREGRTLAAYERRVVARFDATTFVSDEEREVYLAGDAAASNRVHAFRNGVDLAYFDPGQQHASPYDEAVRAVVFTGAMDYRANVDAVTWYAEHVHPQVCDRAPETRFFIVGSNPTAEVQRLGRRPGIVVTGRVDDIRPYLSHAHCVVAPLRVARGLQNKVLEAMALERPLVVTPAAIEGIPHEPSPRLRVCASADDYAAAVIDTATADENALKGPSSRQVIERHFSWDANLAVLDRLLCPVAGTPASDTHA